MPQYFNLSVLYELPFYKNREALLGHVLGGFNISAILTASDGFPWTPVTCSAAEATPGGQTLCPIRPIEYLGGAGHNTYNNAYIYRNQLPTRRQGLFHHYESHSVDPPLAARNRAQLLARPRILSTDISFGKSTNLSGMHMGEARRLDIRANFYNIFQQAEPAAAGIRQCQLHYRESGFRFVPWRNGRPGSRVCLRASASSRTGFQPVRLA